MTSIEVHHDKIDLIESESYITNPCGVYTIDVKFSDEWVHLNKKLIFKTDTFETSILALTCSEVLPIPSEVFSSPSRKFMVRANGFLDNELVLSTDWASLGELTQKNGKVCHSSNGHMSIEDLKDLIDKKADRLTYDDNVFILWAGDLPLSYFNVRSLDGLSAYELAVKHGFKGDIYAWFRTLKGPKGDRGPSGKSAYQIALDFGYRGSIQDWLDTVAPDRLIRLIRCRAITSKRQLKSGAYIFDHVTIGDVLFVNDVVYVESKKHDELILTALNNKRYRIKFNQNGNLISIKQVHPHIHVITNEQIDALFED